MATPWLPDICLTSAQATEPMTRMIDLWAQDWFAKAPWQTLGGWDEAVANSPNPFVLLCRAGGVEIKGEGGVRVTLGLAIAGADDRRAATANDESLLRDLGARAIGDLQNRIAAIVPEPASAATGPGWSSLPRVFSLLVGTVGHARLAIECSLSDLVTMTRSTYPVTSKLEPLQSPVAARSQVAVQVAAQLGTASIKVRELAGLEPGDLLLLDSKPGDYARLIVENRPTNLAVSIRSERDQCLLEFQEEL